MKSKAIRRKRRCVFALIVIMTVCDSNSQVTELKGVETDSGTDGPPPCASSEELSILSGTIVYEGDPVEGVDPERSFDIWVIGAPEWTTKLVAGGSGFDGHPTWSPSGDRIVYSAHGNRNPDLYLVDPTGDNRRRLTLDEGRDNYPRWIREGIVYSSESGRKIVDPVTMQTTDFNGFGPEIESFCYSPDRSQMVVVKGVSRFSRDRHLYLADADGEIVRQLTDDFPREIHPAWSPVRNQVVYSCGDGTRDGLWDVFVLDLDTGKRRQITKQPGPDWACGWSPDGKWLLIASAYEGNWDVYAIRPDGSDRLRITCHAGNARYAEWTSAEPLAK